MKQILFTVGVVIDAIGATKVQAQQVTKADFTMQVGALKTYVTMNLTAPSADNTSEGKNMITTLGSRMTQQINYSSDLLSSNKKQYREDSIHLANLESGKVTTPKDGKKAMPESNAKVQYNEKSLKDDMSRLKGIIPGLANAVATEQNSYNDIAKVSHNFDWKAIGGGGAIVRQAYADFDTFAATLQ